MYKEELKKRNEDGRKKGKQQWRTKVNEMSIGAGLIRIRWIWSSPILWIRRLIIFINFYFWFTFILYSYFKLSSLNKTFHDFKLFAILVSCTHNFLTTLDAAHEICFLRKYFVNQHLFFNNWYFRIRWICEESNSGLYIIIIYLISKAEISTLILNPPLFV